MNNEENIVAINTGEIGYVKSTNIIKINKENSSSNEILKFLNLFLWDIKNTKEPIKNSQNRKKGE